MRFDCVEYFKTKIIMKTESEIEDKIKELKNRVNDFSIWVHKSEVSDFDKQQLIYDHKAFTNREIMILQWVLKASETRGAEKN